MTHRLAWLLIGSAVGCSPTSPPPAPAKPSPVVPGPSGTVSTKTGPLATSAPARPRSVAAVTPGKVPCGATACDAGQAVCCRAEGAEPYCAEVSKTAPGPAWAAASGCVENAPEALAGRYDIDAVGCDENADCGGGICCATGAEAARVTVCIPPGGPMVCPGGAVCQSACATGRCDRGARCRQTLGTTLCDAVGVCRGDAPSVACGDAQCDGPDTLCCEGPGGATCASECPRDAEHTAWSCDDASDCAGVCCVMTIGAGAHCAAVCDTMSSEPTCRTDADCGRDGAATHCKPSKRGLRTCQKP